MTKPQSLASPERAQTPRSLPVRRRGPSPLSGLAMMIGLVLAALVIVPLAVLIREVFFGSSAFANNNVLNALSNPELPGALANTAIVVLSGGSVAVVAGAVLAWLNERTDARMRRMGDALAILPLMFPSVAGTIGWIFLLAPNAGFLNVQLHRSGIGPINIYSMYGMAFVIGVYAVPISYLVVSAALRNVDPVLEEASRMSGAGQLRTFWRVTLPSVRGAIATASVLILMTSIANFTVPTLIGLPAGIEMLSSLIYQAAYTSFPPRIGDALVVSLFMLVIVQAAVLIELGIRHRGRFATIGGRAGTHTLTQLGPWRWVVRVITLLYLAIVTVLPLAALVIVSLQPFWSPNIVLSRLSMMSYQTIFDTGNELKQSFTGSLSLALVSATVLMLAAAVLEFYLKQRSGFVARALNAVLTLPASLPHTVIGIAFLVTLGVGSGRLAGSYLLIFLAYLVLLAPQASRTAGTAMAQLGRQTWEASMMAGAGPMRTWLRIVVPLMLAGLISGWVLVFTGTFGEISAGVFLSQNNRNPVVGPLILDLWQNAGTFPQLAALTLMVTVVQAAFVLIARWLSGQALRSTRERRATW
jgi:iron(III) transport system permease protein